MFQVDEDKGSKSGSKSKTTNSQLGSSATGEPSKNNLGVEDLNLGDLTLKKNKSFDPDQLDFKKQNKPDTQKLRRNSSGVGRNSTEGLVRRNSDIGSPVNSKNPKFENEFKIGVENADNAESGEEGGGVISDFGDSD